MAANDPFFRGEDVTLRFYQQSGGAMKNVYIAAKNWEVEEDATEVAEGVGGENRDRLDKVTNYYRGSVDIFQADQEVMNAIIAAQDTDDANQFPLKQNFAVLIKQVGGVSAAYLCQEAKVGPWKKTMSSRQEVVMLGLKFRFRFYKKIQSL